MKRLKLFRWNVLTLAIAQAASVVSAQEADTLNISGTFHSTSLTGTIGADLGVVYANGYEHAWTLTLHGVTYSHDYVLGQWEDGESGAYGLFEEFYTRVHATSFEFEFFGPDADILNEVVSGQLTGGRLAGDAFLELMNGEYFASSTGEGNAPYAAWGLGLSGSAGVTFLSRGTIWSWIGDPFSVDEYGYPLVEPRSIGPVDMTISDYRPGNSGALFGAGFVDIGSSEPPDLPPPPPPPPPTLSIADALVREGNKGTSRLNLMVTLSRSVTDAVSVQYATVNGTAQAKSDYTATTGTLTFQPGETSRTITVSIKGDRKRELNETFSVELSNADGATIADGVATAMIVNDD
jgi:hypothetical protein